MPPTPDELKAYVAMAEMQKTFRDAFLNVGFSLDVADRYALIWFARATATSVGEKINIGVYL